MLSRRHAHLARVARRALRARGAARPTGSWVPFSRRSPAALPAELRDRLLAIPRTAPLRPYREPVAPASGGLSWLLLSSPVAPLAAGFVLALGLSLGWGNPYLAGAATLDRVRDEASPAASWIHAGANTVASAASDLGSIAVAVLPRTALRASRAVTTTVLDRLDGDQSGAGND